MLVCAATKQLPGFKEFPTDALHHATTIPAISEVVADVLEKHFARKIVGKMDPVRVVQLIETFSREVTHHMLRVLNSKNIMQITYVEFEQVPHSLTPRGLSSPWMVVLFLS